VGWHDERFQEKPDRVKQECLECQKPMWLPISKLELYKTCSTSCKKRHQKFLIESRKKPCETCGKIFLPRPNQLRNGHGRFCSQACNTAARQALLNCPKEVVKAGIERARKAGNWKILKGEDNPRWKGGEEAWKARKKIKSAEKIASGEAARELRAYRKANPDKVKEFSSRRSGRKLGRLEYGCLKKIRSQQKDKCAICFRSLNGKGHMDHIIPLAKGGKHAAANLQFLCPPCNLSKSDKDPLAYMQSLGMLL
jgi:hypothetical protein